jgi:hypothetical protein
MRGVKEIEKVHQRQQPVCSNSNPVFAFLNGLPADGYLRSISIYRTSVVSRTAGACAAGCRPISHGVTSARRTACGAVACFQVELATWTGENGGRST